MIRALLLFPIFLLATQPSIAIRQGTATAEVFIKCYTQSGDFGKTRPLARSRRRMP